MDRLQYGTCPCFSALSLLLSGVSLNTSQYFSRDPPILSLKMKPIRSPTRGSKAFGFAQHSYGKWFNSPVLSFSIPWNMLCAEGSDAGIENLPSQLYSCLCCLWVTTAGVLKFFICTYPQSVPLCGPEPTLTVWPAALLLRFPLFSFPLVIIY